MLSIHGPEDDGRLSRKEVVHQSTGAGEQAIVAYENYIPNMSSAG